MELTDIQPQLRGVPQIEVTFEIIVSGELIVTLTDKSTGKAQDARFELYRSSLGEVDVDVQNKVKDAEKHQEIDEAQREEATAKNSLVSLCRNALYLLDDALFKRKLPEADCSLLADKCTAALEQIAGNSVSPDFWIHCLLVMCPSIKSIDILVGDIAGLVEEWSAY